MEQSNSAPKLLDVGVDSFQNILSFLNADDVFKLKNIRNHLLMIYILSGYKNNFWNSSVKIFSIIYSLKNKCKDRDLNLKKVTSNSIVPYCYLDFFKTLSKQLLPTIIVRIDVTNSLQQNIRCKSLLFATLSGNNLINGWIARIEKTKIDILMQSKQVVNVESSLRTLIDCCQMHRWTILDINIVLGCVKFSTFKIRKPLDDNARANGSSAGAFELDEFLIEKELSELSSTGKRNLEIYNMETQLRLQSESISSIQGTLQTFEHKFDDFITMKNDFDSIKTLLLNLTQQIQQLKNN